MPAEVRPRKRWKKILRWTAWTLLLQFVLINISAALHAYKFSRFYEDPSVADMRPPGNLFTKTWYLFAGRRYPKSRITESPVWPCDTLRWKTGSGLSIEAWYIPADSAAKGTVILFHGLTMNKGRMLREAGEFRYWGYHVLLVDFRAHGNSGGRTTALGWRETEEVKLAYDFIAGKGEKNIFMAGFSLGAVAILKAIPEYGLQPAGIILDMPFASLQDHLRGRARSIGFGGFPEKPFAFFTSFWMGVRLGYSGWGFRLQKFARQVRCPVLLQWGDRDRLTKRKETETIFQAIPGPDKKWVTYPGADHQLLLEYDPVLWRAEVGAFLRQYTR